MRVSSRYYLVHYGTEYGKTALILPVAGQTGGPQGVKWDDYFEARRGDLRDVSNVSIGRGEL